MIRYKTFLFIFFTEFFLTLNLKLASADGPRLPKLYYFNVI